MSQAGLAVVRQLVAVVARTFYKDEYIIALDYLNWHEIARIDVLSKHLRVVTKEAYRIFRDLEKQKLVYRVTRQEDVVLNLPFQRTRKSDYFFIDYRKFVDVVKWRIWKLQGQVQLRTEKEQKNVGYDCPDCKKHFNKMDVLSLIDQVTGVFRCDYCAGELVDNTVLEMELKSRKELTRFTMQTKVILTLLKKTDDITLPPPTPLSEVPVPNPSGDNDGRPDDRGKFGKELGVARDTGVASGDTVIVFAPDLTSKEAARIREAELEKKLRQNQLPAWHIWSTVSGVQMVVDQKITTEARLRHLRYGEGQAFRNSSWNRAERDRARTAARELDKQLRALADGQGDHAEAREELDEAKREAFYARFYASVAQMVGLQLPHDSREGYQLLLDQLAKDEELERAELERRRLEKEKADKERKDAEAAHAAERSANGGGGGGSFRPRGKYFHPYKHGRGGYRSMRRTAPRLFEHVDDEPGAVVSKDKGKEKEKESGKAGERQQQPTVPMPNGSDHEMQSQATVVVDDSMDVCDGDGGTPLTSPRLSDPCVDGIYALSLADRCKLGLHIDDDHGNSSLAVASNGAAYVGTDVDVSVGGRLKSFSSITSDDEGEMSIPEYTEYWNVWHRSQSA
ncbi:hypothetical protein IWW38_001682 [Coemansia aciculifera]|uniref:Uncharacterized protein n=1 Tax=Coemansia aciculifera TaxID=417176 RepID=A0ACC1M7A6_9FUNG|nr:hypothetical protein IWW38_001682 [Coemansia aciculifera]